MNREYAGSIRRWARALCMVEEVASEEPAGQQALKKLYLSKQ